MSKQSNFYNDTVVKPISYFDNCFDPNKTPNQRLNDARKQATCFRDEMIRNKKVRFYKSCNLVRVPYPTKYALRDATTSFSPYIHILNRLFIVQFETSQGLKTLLVSPSDLTGNAETPYFKRLSEQMGVVKNWITPIIAPIYNTVEECLENLNISPDDIDYVTYDHLHTQELRKWFGDTSTNTEAYFKNAKLLVPETEWKNVLSDGLIAPQRDWYCPKGCTGIDENKVIRLQHDVLLGESVALIRTPGHTEGNQSIVIHSEEGLYVTSENGISADSYAPQNSRIPGLSAYAHQTGMEVVLNGNTLEQAVNQYVSMTIEKTIAGESQRFPGFPNMICSSELSWYFLFPTITPSCTFGEAQFGKVLDRDDFVR